jgi:hypothetical protein
MFNSMYRLCADDYAIQHPACAQPMWLRITEDAEMTPLDDEDDEDGILGGMFPQHADEMFLLHCFCET